MVNLRVVNLELLMEILLVSLLETPRENLYWVFHLGNVMGEKLVLYSVK